MPRGMGKALRSRGTFLNVLGLSSKRAFESGGVVNRATRYLTTTSSGNASLCSLANGPVMQNKRGYTLNRGFEATTLASG